MQNTKDPKAWEQLCDGCGKCCLYKVSTYYHPEPRLTRVACHYLNIKDCSCNIYEQRQELVPTCIDLTPENVGDFEWLPETCAYRRRLEGKPLPWWHYLNNGDKNLVHKLGFSACNMAVDEQSINMNNIAKYAMEYW